MREVQKLQRVACMAISEDFYQDCRPMDWAGWTVTLRANLKCNQNPQNHKSQSTKYSSVQLSPWAPCQSAHPHHMERASSEQGTNSLCCIRYGFVQSSTLPARPIHPMQVKNNRSRPVGLIRDSESTFIVTARHTGHTILECAALTLK